MRYFLLLTILISACTVTRSQPGNSVDRLFLDPTGKTYFLLADERLVTDNPLGQNRFEFFDSSLGSPDVVDVANPFSVMLFYADYGQLIILDRTLSERSRLDLFSVEDILEPSTVARASDNKVWVFDNWDYRLKLLDQSGKVSQRSNDLRLEIRAVTPPDAIYVNRGQVLLHYMADNRAALFTNYGRFEQWITFPAADDFAWNPPFLLGRSKDSFWIWNAVTNQRKERPRPQVQGEVNEQWIPLAEGYLRLNPANSETEEVKFN